MNIISLLMHSLAQLVIWHHTEKATSLHKTQLLHVTKKELCLSSVYCSISLHPSNNSQRIWSHECK